LNTAALRRAATLYLIGNKCSAAKFLTSAAMKLALACSPARVAAEVRLDADRKGMKNNFFVRPAFTSFTHP
jgi:hypothetical protein